LPVPWLRGLDGRLRAVLDWRDPAVKRFFVLMLPVTLTLGLINVNIFVNMLFASRLVDPELAPTAIEKAFRIYMLPQGMFSVAVVTVLFPTLSRFAAVGNLPSFRATVDSGMRQIAFLLLPAAAVSAVLAQPIVRLLYERGAFTADNTVVVAQCLAAFSLGLMFNGWMLLLSRGFYSLQRNWVPTTIALGTVGLNAVLDAILYRVGVWGIPLATSLVNIVGVGLLLVVMRRSPGFAGPRRVVASVLRILAASAAAAGAAFGVWWVLDDLLGRALWAQIVSLGVGLGVAVLVYLGAATLLGVRELEALRALRRR
jgi:putative peptidoglycan lipid II flippase